jgi:NDP-sugar pyrophosphorylase family protein
VRFVLLHTATESFQPVQAILPAALIPFLDKPLIQLQLESAYDSGVRACTVIASDGIEKIRAYCGDGTRFGISLQLNTGVASGAEVPSLTKHRSLFNEPFVVMSGSVQARLPYKKIFDDHLNSKKKLTVVRAAGSQAVLAFVCSPEAWGFFKGKKGCLKQLADGLLQQEEDSLAIVDLNIPYVVCRNLGEILEVNNKLLTDQSSAVFSTLQEVNRGVYLGHHVSIDPKATIRPPVVIGDFCQIMDGAVVGPYACVGNETIVGKQAIIRNSIVGKSSYVGNMIQVVDSIVLGSSLVNLKSGVKVVITDSFLLDDISSGSPSETVESLIHRAVAAGLLGALAPAWIARLLLMKKEGALVKSTQTLGSGNVSSKEDIDYLPRFEKLSADPANAPLSWYPTLLNIVRGQMRFVGPGTVSPEEATAATGVGYEKRFSALPGLVAIGDLFDSDGDETRIAEIIYANSRNLTQDARILLARFLRSLLGKAKTIRLAGL